MPSRQESLLTWALLALCAALAAWNLYPRLTVSRTPVQIVQPDITVAVEGAVERPGTYTLPWGARVEDLVRAAGGLGPEAERTLVNLAEPLDTGQLVVVPRQRADNGERRLSLNSASEAELVRLPGIGPALAARIRAARPFSAVEDLLRVPGIGPKTLEALRPLVRP